jgi:hypothetical protein
MCIKWQISWLKYKECIRTMVDKYYDPRNNMRERSHSYTIQSDMSVPRSRSLYASSGMLKSVTGRLPCAKSMHIGRPPKTSSEPISDKYASQRGFPCRCSTKYLPSCQHEVTVFVNRVVLHTLTDQELCIPSKYLAGADGAD